MCPPRASTAGGRAGTFWISLAGPLVAAYMLTWQPEYIGRFATLPLGWTMLTAAIVLQLIGMVWISRLMRSDY